jgi:hypothetical protein
VSDDLNVDEFLVPQDGANEPRAIYERLVRECPEFVHLREGEPAVEFLLRNFQKVKAGREVLGTCYLPTVQGELKPMFEWMMVRLFGFLPDFLIVLDRAFWNEADALEREILMFHEMMHAGQKVDRYGTPMFSKDSGLPLWCINGHDVEEFTETVRRYGAYSADIQAFIAAAGEQSHSE